MTRLYKAKKRCGKYKSAVFTVTNYDHEANIDYGSVILQVDFNVWGFNKDGITFGNITESKTSTVKIGSCNLKGKQKCCLTPIQNRVKIQKSKVKNYTYFTFTFRPEFKIYKDFYTQLRLRKKGNGPFESDPYFNKCSNIAEMNTDAKGARDVWYLYVVHKNFDTNFISTTSVNIDPFFCRFCDNYPHDTTIETFDMKARLTASLK